MNRKSKIWLYILAVVVVLIFNFPLVFVIVTSFKPLGEIMLPNLKFTFSPTLENYKMLFSETFPFGKYILNSITISLISTIGALAVAVPGSYGISRFGKVKKNVAFWILSIRMAPPVVFALPLFLILKWIKLIDTIPGLVMVYFTFTVPLSIWILNTFLMEIPKSVEESAMIDGATRGQILYRIIFPLLMPGIVAVFIMNFIFSWNEFFFALLMTMDRAVTITVGTARFVTGYSIYWGAICAASTISVIPMIIMTFLVQKYLVRGLTMGAIK
ncbi:MAG: carbohydrate ABC transporter permease [Thermotoga sp.]|nr:MAG: carbohydrate ABC transporter permease [Thermotoga sp.]